MTEQEYKQWVIRRGHAQSNQLLVDGAFGAVGHGFRYAAVWLTVTALTIFGYLAAVIGILYVLCKTVGVNV